MEGSISTQNLIIILATTIPSAVLLTFVSMLCYRARRRRARLFNRSTTPIDDEEIESWKADRRASEKFVDFGECRKDQPSSVSCHNHRTSTSVGSIQKPASVIIYRSPSVYSLYMSDDHPMVPQISRQGSVELPQIPVLARAPNSRPGLTDEAVQGDDAFVSLRRQTSKLVKTPRSVSLGHNRSKSTRATMSSRDTWFNDSLDFQQARRSADIFLPKTPLTHKEADGVSSSDSTPPRESFDTVGACHDGLLPSLHQSEIGRAIG